jgi:predicted RNA-binding Zn ribbon-like protein
MSKERNIQTLLLDGGCHCFNFINTVNSRKEEEIFDYLQTYDDLLEWSDRVKLLPRERLKQLNEFAKKNTKSAEKKLKEIKSKRELLYHIFSLIIHNKIVDESSAKDFNDVLSDSLSNLVFKFNKGKLDLGWNEKEVNMTEPLWVVMKDAFDIFTSLSLSRFKECDACGWIFLDKSKNNSRVWCNMQTCGSIDKAKRYYYRKKGLR